MDQVGLVTITYNSAKVLPSFLECVWKQTFSNFLLYVIDNASNDDTINILQEQKDDRLRVILNKNNVGVAAGNNQGIKNAISDNCNQVLIINNDVEFEQFLLENLLVFQRKNKCSIVAPKIKYYNTQDTIWYAGSHFDLLKGYLPVHRGMRKKDIGQFDSIKIVEYAPTCCVLLCKNVFLDVGYMDEKFFVYFDDVDFFYRVLKDKRHKLYYYPHAKFYHKVGSLTDSISQENSNNYRGDFFLKQNIKNHIYFLKKIGGGLSYFFIFWFLFRNNIRFFISSNIRKDFSTFILINKAYLSGIRMKV